jgi:AraC-like DNA-binding protein
LAYRELPVSTRLRSLVAAAWAFPTHHHVHRVLPDGCMDLVFMDGRARVVGAMRSAVVVPPRSGATLGLRLRPGEAEQLFPGLAGDLTDAEASLEQSWGDDGRRLEDALLALLEKATASHLDACAILRAAVPVLEHALTARLASHRVAVDVRTRAATVLLADGVSVADVGLRVGLSERQLGRRFHERVGLSPKAFARVRRLQRAALLMKRGATPSDASAAVGYADQPHFTREARALAGITPRGLAAELSDGLDTAVPVAL